MRASGTSQVGSLVSEAVGCRRGGVEGGAGVRTTRVL